MKIQGRYLPTHITHGLSVTKEITIGGAFIGRHVLRISATRVTWDGAAIVTTFPSSWSHGLVHIDYNNQGEFLQKGREKLGHGALKVLHIHLPDGVDIQVNQWTNADEGFFINTRIHMPPQPAQDGYCGNFNGNALDDDRIAIRNRLGHTGVPQAELVGFKVKTPVATTYHGHPSISKCETELLMKAHDRCKDEEKQFIPSMGCIVRKCDNGLDA